MTDGHSYYDNLFLLNKLKSAAQLAARQVQDDTSRREFAEDFCYSVLDNLWRLIVLDVEPNWHIPKFEHTVSTRVSILPELAVEVADAASKIDRSICGYYVGTLYASLLPDRLRSEWGVYYTPPALARRLVSTADDDLCWQKAKIIDPACGGAAFLAPIAERMWRQMTELAMPSYEIVHAISENLIGIEIDRFAAWMSQVLTEIQLLPLTLQANHRLGQIAQVGDALNVLYDHAERYDLVLGNPPYGKVSLSSVQRLKWSRSLYGHANLYGLFTDLALHVAKPKGTVALVTPTSFLGGQYFKKLRGLIASEAPPVVLDFVRQRDGVFQGVLQETALVVYKKGQVRPKMTRVSVIDADKSNGMLKILRVSTEESIVNGSDPWLVPRDSKHISLLREAKLMRHRLADYNFVVSTGQLVWNRHKDQLRSERVANCAPLIWAESVMPDGIFRFQSMRANHKPYFEVRPNQQHLLTRQPGILVQRTTAKEQSRRIVAAVLSEEFLEENGGAVVVENHLNIIRPLSGLFPELSLDLLATLLNSNVLDHIFRCISGSVAVSAYELGALPLPDPDSLEELEGSLGDSTKEDLDTLISKLYGLEQWQPIYQ